MYATLIIFVCLFVADERAMQIDDDETDDEFEDKERQLHKGAIAEEFEEEGLDSEDEQDYKEASASAASLSPVLVSAPARGTSLKDDDETDDEDMTPHKETTSDFTLATHVWEFQLTNELTRDGRDQKYHWRPVGGERVLVFEEGRGFVQGIIMHEQGVDTKEFVIAIKDREGKEMKVTRHAQMEFGNVAYNYITPDLRPLKSSGKILQDPRIHLKWQTKLWHINSIYDNEVPASSAISVQDVDLVRGQFTYTYMLDPEHDQPGHAFTARLSEISRQREGGSSVALTHAFLPFSELSSSYSSGGSESGVVLHPHTLRIESGSSPASASSPSTVVSASSVSATQPPFSGASPRKLKLKLPLFRVS